MVALDAPGEFMGKDELREIAADPPNRFKTLRIDRRHAARVRRRVTTDGDEVGVLTSPAVSPRFGPIGLAILRSDVAADGTTVRWRSAEGTVGATVDVLAIYDPEKRRPRG